jgi:hypothetical protein
VSGFYIILYGKGIIINIYDYLVLKSTKEFIREYRSMIHIGLANIINLTK